MIGWGPKCRNRKKETLLAYLVKNFGPDNDRFEPRDHPTGGTVSLFARPFAESRALRGGQPRWPRRRLPTPPPPAEIQQVERGLRRRVLLKGEKTWTIEERMRFHKVPAVSIAVFGSGKILWAKAYGLADADAMTPATDATLFQAASISKPVSALAALEEGRAGQARARPQHQRVPQVLEAPGKRPDAKDARHSRRAPEPQRRA